MAVVKADAYGHGAVRCAKTALNSGAEYLGVATVNEAIELREALVNAPILVLSQPPDEAIPLLLAYKVMPSVYTPEFAIRYAEAADAFGMPRAVPPGREHGHEPHRRAPRRGGGVPARR